MTLFAAFLKRYWASLAWLLLIATVAIFQAYCWYRVGVNTTNASWSSKWSARDAAGAQAKAREEASQRNTEQQRLVAASEEGRRADEELAKAKASAADAQRAGDGLQRQLAAIQAKYRRSETSRLSAIAAAGEAKTQAARVLAELLSESDKRAGIYAAEADRAYIAGNACERIYSKVTR